MLENHISVIFFRFRNFSQFFFFCFLNNENKVGYSLFIAFILKTDLDVTKRIWNFLDLYVKPVNLNELSIYQIKVICIRICDMCMFLAHSRRKIILLRWLYSLKEKKKLFVRSTWNNWIGLKSLSYWMLF